MQSTRTATRTILITGFKDTTHRDEWLSREQTAPGIREAYVLGDTPALFLCFYDIRASEKYLRQFSTAGLHAHYTLSRYELPKRADECGPSNRQASVLFFFKGFTAPVDDEAVREHALTFGAIRELRNSKPFQKVIEFYDARDAEKAHAASQNIPFANGFLHSRFVWDITFGYRNELLQAANRIVGDYAALEAAQGGKKEGRRGERKSREDTASSKEKGSGSTAVSDGRAKRVRLSSDKRNVFLKIFDKLIIENLGAVEKVLKGAKS